LNEPLGFFQITQNKFYSVRLFRKVSSFSSCTAKPRLQQDRDDRATKVDRLLLPQVIQFQSSSLRLEPLWSANFYFASLAREEVGSNNTCNKNARLSACTGVEVGPEVGAEVDCEGDQLAIPGLRPDLDLLRCGIFDPRAKQVRVPSTVIQNLLAASVTGDKY
jgi:hypothetical protein